MPEYLSPGVYVEEIDFGIKPITGVSTSTAGFLGPAERGPVRPQFVSGFPQFMQTFGGFRSASYLPYAVDGFFRNGGQRCFVGRIVSSTAKTATLDLGPFRLEAVGPGKWGNRIYAKISKAPLADQGRPDAFDLALYYWQEAPPAIDPGAGAGGGGAPAAAATGVVDPTDARNRLNTSRRDPDVLEVYDNLSPDPMSPDFYGRRIESGSRLVRAIREDDTAPYERPADQGAVEVATLNPPAPGSQTKQPGTALTTPLAAGDDGAALALGDFTGLAHPADVTLGETGLLSFEAIDEIALVAIPDEDGTQGLREAVIGHAERMGDRFAVAATGPKYPDVTDVAKLRPPLDARNAAVYHPWLRILDPITGAPREVPPHGHVLGVYARTDNTRGVHKAPANEDLLGVVDLTSRISKAEQDLLNPRGMNALRAFTGRGIRVWGARTMSTNGLWRYINVRRLFLMIEESIDEGTQWAVFEPNDISLWERIRGSVISFLTTQWRDGALMGATPEEAFFVRVGVGETMTMDDVDNGRIIILVGIAPVKPAEFVIFRIAQIRPGQTV